MSIHRSILTLAVTATLGTISAFAADSGKPGASAPANNTPANNAEGKAAPANNSPPNVAPANNTPTKSNGPNANTNEGQFTNAPGTKNANENDGKAQNDLSRRRNQAIGRIVYIPGYGYSNWNGDYSSPYWSTAGTWYNNDGVSNQRANGNSNVTTPVQSTRPEAEAAQAEMTSTRARLAKQFESSDEVRAALHDVKEAQHAYDAAVAKSKRNLKNNPEYKQVEAEKQQAARKVEAAQAADRQPAPSAAVTQPAPISPEVLRAAQQKLNVATEEKAIVADQGQTDSSVIEAREKLETAADKLNGMKDKFDATLQADPQWQTAKQKLDAARSGAR